MVFKRNAEHAAIETEALKRIFNMKKRDFFKRFFFAETD